MANKPFHLFSLISPPPETKIYPQDDDVLENNISDGFETPRSSSISTSSISTPRSLFSTPPRSPPKTPPRPTRSHVDDRIRMRRYKSSMSPSLSPVKSSRNNGDDDLLSNSNNIEDDPLCHHHDTDISFSSGDDSKEDTDYMSTPDNTPNSSPRKSDLLSLSPIQQRLERARLAREQILEERCANIHNKSKSKVQLANKRKEDAILEKMSKARTDESISNAKSKREQILIQRVQQIEVKSKLKEMEASKRKEDVTRELIEKARTELAKTPIAKDRREQQLALRVQSVEATLEYKTEAAQKRSERHLFEKQQRACCKERKERAERRRKLISYEKRAKLLAALDAKLERAAIKSSKLNEEKAIRAGEDIVKAKEVSRRVKAARIIQSCVREAYGIDSPIVEGSNIDLSQHDAAERLQRWFMWRVHVCKRRLYGDDSGDENNGTSSDAIKALTRLLELFPLSSDDGQQQPPPFEQISQIMMQPQTLKMAMVIVDSIRPINEVSFGASSSSSSSQSAKTNHPKMDGRTLLSLLLIAIHPCEVLGDDFNKATTDDGTTPSKGSCLLANSSKALLEALGELLTAGSNAHGAEVSQQLLSISKLSLQTTELFNWWKRLDMTQLLDGLSKQLEQSWVVYLTSSDALRYLAEVTGVESGVVSSKEDDPLLSLRLRHEASRAGSRSHIKRIRLSLNKLIGLDEGKVFVKDAKTKAQRDIEDSNTLVELKQEVDEIYGNISPGPSIPDLSGDSSTATTKVQNEEDIPPNNKGVTMPDINFLPNELMSNRMLVHKILLTDPEDFGTLSWDGSSNAQQANVTPEEFISSFVVQITSQDQSSDNASHHSSMEDIPIRIAQSMKLAFFTKISEDMMHGNYNSVRDLLRELHTKMRSLLPSREDLHSHLNDEDVSLSSSTSDVLRNLIRSGYLLSNYLESAARAPTTLELVECLEAFNSHPIRDDNGNVMIPYEIESEELFAVASVAYILHKVELCQVDIANYKLSQAAPLLHLVGNEYERKHFMKTNGNYSSSTTIEELQHMVPSTKNWIKKMQSLFGSSENLTVTSNLQQKMDFVKGRGFVDGILFTRNQLALPEILSLDVESINRIRSEARSCVIASALALHACNISKVGTSVLSSNVMSDEVNSARQVLSSVLKKKHFDQNKLESDVTQAIGNLTKALAERDLTEEEQTTLSNHTIAVLHGNDPVLKLLDNRVQSFFRFACKWKPDSTSSTSSGTTVAPLEMKTGRSVLKGDVNNTSAAQGIKSTKQEFELAANKEGLRLGFAFFVHDLIKAGNEARGIISLACMNYGQGILDRFLGVLSLLSVEILVGE